LIGCWNAYGLLGSYGARYSYVLLCSGMQTNYLNLLLGPMTKYTYEQWCQLTKNCFGSIATLLELLLLYY
jgi:hypothetical protein